MEHWLRTMREEVGLTQDDIAARLQLEGLKFGRSAISNWESGRTPVPLKDPEFVQLLASILKTTENKIMLAAGYRLTTKNHTQISERIANIVDDLPPDKQQMALRVIQAIAK